MQEMETQQSSSAFKNTVVSVKEYAKRKGITVQAVYWQINQGKLKTMKLDSFTLVYL
jgi:DNA invertase Pin-like site-specific DNA recombinase